MVIAYAIESMRSHVRSCLDVRIQMPPEWRWASWIYPGLCQDYPKIFLSAWIKSESQIKEGKMVCNFELFDEYGASVHAQLHLVHSMQLGGVGGGGLNTYVSLMCHLVLGGVKGHAWLRSTSNWWSRTPIKRIFACFPCVRIRWA